MKNHFVIRTYGFGELAQLYSPNVSPITASTKLRRWITLNSTLNELIPPQTRDLTPKMVKAIIKEFDLPESYMREFWDF